MNQEIPKDAMAHCNEQGTEHGRLSRKGIQ